MTYFWENPVLAANQQEGAPLGVDEDAARELEIYIDNDARFSPQGQGQGRVIAVNLLGKMRRGTYNHALAPRAWEHVVDRAAKEYTREIAGAPAREWSQIFPRTTRRYVASEIANEFAAAVERGEYSHLQRQL